MLKLLEFIKDNPDNWEEILAGEPYCVYVKRDGGYMLFKYSRIGSDFSQPVVRECRGIILDMDFVPVCVPFFKFDNFGEPTMDIVDWDTAAAEEKLDGSLIKLWYHDGKWRVSTNGTIDAYKAPLGVTCGGRYATFGNLFDAAAEGKLDYDRLDKDCVYMFELVSPENRIVVAYDDSDIVHLGTRRLSDLKEIEADIGVRKPRKYPFGTSEELVAAAKALPYSDEGYVVVDADYKRVKIKSPAYVAAAHMISGINEKRIISLIRHGEVAELLAYFPEYAVHVEKIEARLKRFEDHLNDIVVSEMAKFDGAPQKDFAEFAKSTGYPEFFFGLRKGSHSNVREWLWNSLDPDTKALKRLEQFESRYGTEAP